MDAAWHSLGKHQWLHHAFDAAFVSHPLPFLPIFSVASVFTFAVAYQHPRHQAHQILNFTNTNQRKMLK